MINFENKKFYITTAIAYPNSIPHLGHALEIIEADALARFHRLTGKEVFFQTGTDEHGLKNWQASKKEGKDILEFLDSNVSVFKELYKMLDISYDYFIRTSNKDIHYPGAQKLWKSLVKAGDIYLKSYKGLYCAGCEAFKTDKELIDGRCPNHPTREIESVEEENYFFKMSKYKDKIFKLIKSDEYKVMPESRKNEILSFLKEAKDISFSRSKSSLPWGIPVPDDEEHIMYVWCDALSNYITGPGYGTNEKKFNQIWPADIHIIGKDILRFHAAFWPAMLLSARINLPKTLFVHGFILSKGVKMSKSTGNVTGPFEQIEKYGSDPFRYCMLSSMPLDSDGDYSEELIVEKTNNELVANIGNFCYRVLSFLEKYFDSGFDSIEEDGNLSGEIIRITEKIKKDYELVNFNNVVHNILKISSIGNKYFQDNEPWKLIKQDKEKAHRILGSCVNIVKILGIIASPILPEFFEKVKHQLDIPSLDWNDINFNLNKHKINKAEILFEKIDLEEEKAFPLNLKVAEILETKDHPGADKLYILQILLGDEKRQLVAGLKEYYSKEDLLNKKIIVVTNLKPAKLRGIESQGMLLAAEDKEDVGLLTVKDSKPGDSITAEGYINNTAQISFDDFLKVKLIVKDGKACFDDIVLKVNNEEIKAEKVKQGQIR